MEFAKAFDELKKEKKRKFTQSVDLIVNLREFDVRKESINTFISLPHSPEKKICGFLTRKSPLVDTVTKDEFDRFKTAKDVKKLANSYDHFIAAAPLMGAIATTFGRVFGPLNKMPSPQAGVIPVDNDDAIKAMIERMKSMVRVKTKDASIKVTIGNENMSAKDLEANAKAILRDLENKLPKKKDNIKNVVLKFTMTKPLHVEL